MRESNFYKKLPKMEKIEVKSSLNEKMRLSTGDVIDFYIHILNKCQDRKFEGILDAYKAGKEEAVGDFVNVIIPRVEKNREFYKNESPGIVEDVDAIKEEMAKNEASQNNQNSSE